MADFRKWFYALAVVALLAGFIVPASAQNTPFECSAATAVTPTVRSEGLTELVGDLTLTCTGGTPTAAGQPVPGVNISIQLNTNLTSRLLATAAVGYWNEALLIIDEPHSAINATRPILNCGNAGAADTGPSGPNVCSITSTGNPAQTYDGTPCATGSTYGCGRPNVFQGHTGAASNPSQSNSVYWLGVPLDPPGTITTRTIRITNIRAEANIIGAVSPYALNFIYMGISINSSTALSLNSSQQTVAYVQHGIYTVAGSSGPNFLQCNSVTGVGVGSFIFQEGFGSSWKPKNISYMLPPGTSGGNGLATSYLSYDLTTVNHPPDLNQNVAGAIYNTESGFMYPGASSVDGSTVADPVPNPPTAIGTVPVTATAAPLHNGTLIDNAGIADAGTRLMFQISATPTVMGATILVPDAIYLSNGTQTSGIAVLTTPSESNGSTGAGTYAPVYTGTSAATAVGTYSALPSTGIAIYEVLFADPFSIETATVVPEVTYTPNLSMNLPTVGVSPVANGGFAPIYSTSSGAISAAVFPTTGYPIPRFVPTTPINAPLFSINKCACDLLFPFVSASGGYDTGIAIANTSLDNLSSTGTSLAKSQFGGVQFWYYGTGASGGLAPTTQCTNTATAGLCPSNVSSTTQLVGPGQVLTYVLSSGGGSIGSGANGLDNRANGFSGYIIAQTQFQYCHAFAFITAVGAGPLTQAVSEGYLGLVLDNMSWNCLSSSKPGLCRTAQSAENLVH